MQRRRIRRWGIAISIALVIALPVAFFLMYGGQERRALPRSGDALFDRYAAYVWSDYQQRRLDDKDASPNLFVPMDEAVKWEAEFGSDPRYWELRSQSAFFDYETGSHKPWRQMTQADKDALQLGRSEFQAEQLREARRRGVVSSHGLVMLWLETRSRANVPDQDAILQEAIEKDPHYSWAQYCRGLSLLGQGRKVEAKDCLALGNAAALAPVPMPFPYDVLDRGRQGQGPRAARILGSDYRNYLLPQNWLQFRNDVVLNIGKQDFIEHPGLLTELNRFSCRMYQGNSDDLTAALISLAIVGWMRKSAEEAGEHTPPIWAVSGILDRMNRLGTNLLMASTNNLNTKNKAYSLLGKLGLKGVAKNQYRREQAQEASYTRTEYAPYFEALAEFDYTNPQVTPRMQRLLDTVPDPSP